MRSNRIISVSVITVTRRHNASHNFIMPPLPMYHLFSVPNPAGNNSNEHRARYDLRMRRKRVCRTHRDLPHAPGWAPSAQPARRRSGRFCLATAQRRLAGGRLPESAVRNPRRVIARCRMLLWGKFKPFVQFERGGGRRWGTRAPSFGRPASPRCARYSLHKSTKREDDMWLRRCLPQQRVLRVYLLLALSPTASQSTSHKRF